MHTLQFADTTDLVNLAIFFGMAGIVGTLGSRRRAAQFRAESLARELQQANIELARLAETERQVRLLEETDRLRREVLANVSHELRTPMASLLTGTTTLLRRRSLPDDLRPDIDSLAIEARRLKAALLFRPGTVVMNVPHHIGRTRRLKRRWRGGADIDAL